MNTEEAAEYLGRKRKTLEWWRVLGKGPKWQKSKAGWVTYTKSALDAWQKENGRK